MPSQPIALWPGLSQPRKHQQGCSLSWTLRRHPCCQLGDDGTLWGQSCSALTLYRARLCSPCPAQASGTRFLVGSNRIPGTGTGRSSTAKPLVGLTQNCEPSTAHRAQNRHQLRFPWALWVTRLLLPVPSLQRAPQTGPCSLLVPAQLQQPGSYLVAWVANSCSSVSFPFTACTISSKDGGIICVTGSDSESAREPGLPPV